MSQLLELFQMMDLIDLIDILLTSVIFYYAFKFIRERRAGKLAFGVLILAGLEVVSTAFHLPVIGFLMQTLFQVGLIAMIILFQPELRSALEKIGGVQVGDIRGIISPGDAAKQKEQLSQTLEDVCTAVCDMSLTKTGALIVFERAQKLDEYVRSGTVINADATPRLIKSVFFNKAPLHDGAVIIRNQRVYAASCLLPLAADNEIDRDLGTRHRAAIGMSSVSDAVVVVVSEETGTISVCKKGSINRNYNYRQLYDELMEEMTPARSNVAVNAPAKRKRKNRKNKDSQESAEN
ncbi:MAG: diadenylate cyclase CdaA [Clostridia bacterium]|nr:diadenylate cyclase CdaA [Clostridia bacterium]